VGNAGLKKHKKASYVGVLVIDRPKHKQHHHKMVFKRNHILAKLLACAYELWAKGSHGTLKDFQRCVDSGT